MMLPAPLLFIAELDEKGSSFPSLLRAALTGGCKWVMLRNTKSSDAMALSAALYAKNMCKEHSATLYISRDVKLARHIKADGLHMPANTPAWRFKALGMPVGQSCHNETELRLAEEMGLDYATLSPVFNSVSKKNYPGMGLNKFRGLTAKAEIPVCALGGILPENARDALFAGADAVAVAGGIAMSPNPQARTEAYLKALKSLEYAA